jgi:hypothetical protein
MARESLATAVVLAHRIFLIGGIDTCIRLCVGAHLFKRVGGKYE